MRTRVTRILVVEHEADAGIGLVGEQISAAGAEMVAVGPETGREVPRTAEGYDGVVVLGGSPSPTDETPAWFPQRPGAASATAWTGRSRCWGSAWARSCSAWPPAAAPTAYAEVPRSASDTLWRTDAAAGDPLLGDLPETTRSLQWHSYEVRDLPPGSVALVRSERCANQAFRVGSVAWGVQFHLEALAATPAAWSIGHGDELAGRRPDRRGAGRADERGRAGAAGDLGAGRRPLARRSWPPAPEPAESWRETPVASNTS